MVLPHRIVSRTIEALWLVWAIYWFVHAFRNKRTVYQQSFASILIERLILFISIFVLIEVHPLRVPIFQETAAAQVSGIVLCAAGVAISIWARKILGRNWSGVATLKENHELVRSGPYRFVRHPIYSGIILALLGTVLATGPFVFSAIAVLVIAVLFKFRSLREEKLMLTQFPEAYPQYMQDVKSLIPYVY